MSINDIDAPYIDLAGAIVRQAKNDYMLALFTDNESNIKALERWFESEWAQFLTLGKSKDIVYMIRRDVRNGYFTLHEMTRYVKGRFYFTHYTKKQLRADCKKCKIELKGTGKETTFPAAKWENLCNYISANIRKYH